MIPPPLPSLLIGLLLASSAVGGGGDDGGGRHHSDTDESLKISQTYDAAWGHPAADNSSLSSRSKRWAPHRRHRRPPPPAAAAGLKRGKEDGRSGRLFSIFTPVVFVDDPCRGVGIFDDVLGICMTSSQCSGISGGQVIGNCAAGFGTCCLIVVTEPGSTITRNCTYIQNEEFPGPRTTGSSSLSWTIDRVSDDICFIRLDFVTLVVENADLLPGTGGACDVDTVTFTQGNGYPVPTLCGIMNGQHMYLDTGGLEVFNPITMSTNFGNSDFPRRWRVKVSYIPCDSPLRPPRGCNLYYTGVSGRLDTYNFEGRFHLNSNFYSICVRQERGRCSIRYQLPPGVPLAFSLSDQVIGNPPNEMPVSRTGQNCFNDYAMIPRSRHAASSPSEQLCTVKFNGIAIATQTSDRFCGIFLNCIRNSMVSTPAIIQEGPPFEVRIATNEIDNDMSLPINDGVTFDFLQLPC